MSLSRAGAWSRLKELSFNPTKSYNQYTTQELNELLLQLDPEATPDAPVAEAAPAAVVRKNLSKLEVHNRLNEEAGFPVAGATSYSHSLDEPLYTDEQGVAWFQEEIRKPAHPRPRIRRKIQYVDSGTEVHTTVDGRQTETFEISGRRKEVREATITLPNYQVGIAKHPQLPFRTVHYEGRTGYHHEDIIEFYGGLSLVPETCKTMYVSIMMCYDIDSVHRALQEEARRIKLREGNFQ